MRQHLHRRLQGNDGFSVLELMIVVMILGVLAVVAMPALSSYHERAQMAVLIATGKSIRGALTTLAADDAQSLYPAAVTMASLAAAGAPLRAADYLLTYAQTGTPVGASYTLLLEQRATGHQVCITPAHTKKTTAGACA